MVICLAVYAQSPKSFQYQAVVRDASGSVLVSHPVTFKLSIIWGVLPGTVEYVETHSSTTNAFGIATLAVGNGTPVTNLFSDIDWSVSPHYLKVEVNTGTGLVDMGTTQLLSVPYSLYSEKSGGSFWTNSGSDIYNVNSGNVGVGINNPVGKMVVKGDASALPTEPLFEVKNAAGQTVFVVYPDSVHVFVKDDGSKSNNGGFAVSGRSNTKSVTDDYLLVDPNHTRVYTGDPTLGFGVEGIGVGTTSYMNVTPNNCFIGHESGINNTTGMFNSCLGYQAGKSNQMAQSNVFVGYQSGMNTIGLGNYWWEGGLNVFVGYQAGMNNTQGGQNVAVGSNSLQTNTVGDFNLALGFEAMFSNNDGNMNMGMGKYALHNNDNGNENCAIGAYTLQSNISGSNNVAVGGGSLSANTNGSVNTALGVSALSDNISGTNNIGIGKFALDDNQTGNYNTAVGDDAGYSGSYYNYSNSTMLGAGAYTTASNSIRIGNSSVISIGGQVSWTSFSDGRFKDNVQENVPGLDFIMKLRPVTYNFNIHKLEEFRGKKSETSFEGKYDIEKNRYTGFIAQEVEKAAKELGFDFSGVDKSGKLMGLKYSEFTVPLVKAVQELNSKNEELQKVIDSIQEENESLKSDNNILKTKVQEIDNLKAEIEKIKKYQSDKQ